MLDASEARAAPGRENKNEKSLNKSALEWTRPRPQRKRLNPIFAWLFFLYMTIKREGYSDRGFTLDGFALDPIRLVFPLLDGTECFFRQNSLAANDVQIANTTLFVDDSCQYNNSLDPFCFCMIRILRLNLFNQNRL